MTKDQEIAGLKEILVSVQGMVWAMLREPDDMSLHSALKLLDSLLEITPEDLLKWRYQNVPNA